MQKSPARAHFIRLVNSPPPEIALNYAASAANVDLSDTAKKFINRFERRCGNEQKKARGTLAASTQG